MYIICFFYLRLFSLGDAAHAMTSNAGLGANTAFKDALLLSQLLGKKIGILILVRIPKEHFILYT